MSKHSVMRGRPSQTGLPNGISSCAPWLPTMPPQDRVQHEAARLILQAELYDPITRRFLIEAGIRVGMRVLDVGSGTGAVSLLLSDLVGPSGSVVGVEYSAPMLDIAVERSRSAGKTNITFFQGNVEFADLTSGFNAIVGRFVVRELKDAAQSIRKLSRLLVPEGIVAFQEKVLAIPVTSFPHLSVVNKVCSWMDEARRRAAVETSTGIKLPQFYITAGLPSPNLRFDAPVGYGSAWVGYNYLVEMLRGMLPLVRLYGIASEEEIGINELVSKMQTEAAALSSVVTLTPCIGAWSSLTAGRRAGPRTL